VVKPLPHHVRAEIFLQLSRLESAGIAYDRAVATMAVAPPAAQRLIAFQALAARGIDAARAGEQSGLFTSLEARLVRAALTAGSPAPTYQRLAEYHAQRARQWGLIKARFAMPAFVLAIALVIQPLPGLISGATSIKSFAWQVSWPILVIAAIVVALRWLHARGARSSGRSIYQQVPLYGPIFVRMNLRDFLESLALMLEAGVPMLDALPPAIETVADGDIRRELARARKAVEQKKTFAQALDGVSYLRGSPALEFAHTGEQSGTLPEMLMRHAAIETDAIASFYEQLAAWLPRVIYLLVVIKVAAGILTSGGVAPQIPSDL
jgi:general secretion pathway protein F